MTKEWVSRFPLETWKGLGSGRDIGAYKIGGKVSIYKMHQLLPVWYGEARR